MALSRREFGAAALGSFAFADRSPPRLLVMIVAEQFRPDYLVRWQSHFVAGGFRRLLDDGAVYLDCRHQAATFPSSALATLSTGCYPAAHGIIADQWFEPRRRERVRAGAHLLEATTLAGQVARQGGGVYGIAYNAERAALLTGLETKQIIDTDAGGAIQAKSGGLPWLPAFERAHDPEQARDAKWLAIGAKTGAPPLRTLRYDPARPQEFTVLYQASPFGQAAQFALVRELVDQEKLGRGAVPDCVVLLAESTALLGYETGAESPLMHQLVLHMDRHVEATLEALNKSVGAGNYVVVFCGAHGSPVAGSERRAISGEAVAKSVDTALGGEAVERYVYPFLYLRAGPRTREGRLAAARAALQTPGIAGYYTADGECSHSGEWRWRFENSFHPRAGDVMLLYAPEYVEDYGPSRGISYGSFYNYDTQTPLIFYGPQFVGQRIERTVEPVDMAPTLARAFGLPLPSSTTGRILTDAFAPPKPAR